MLNPTSRLDTPQITTEVDDEEIMVTWQPYADVHRERIRAHYKHINDSAEVLHWRSKRWLPILTEEVGEVARCLNEYDLWNVTTAETRLELRKELIQVAAMAVAWIDAIDQEVR